MNYKLPPLKSLIQLSNNISLYTVAKSLRLASTFWSNHRRIKGASAQRCTILLQPTN